MTIPFIKMHGLGNDYVYVDGFDPELDALLSQTDLPALARRLSDRHCGVGSDGLVLILPSEKADAKMRIFNADGSEATMCGNASRCIGKYLYEHGQIHTSDLTLDTLSGIKQIHLTIEHDHVTDVTVDMGVTIGNPHQVRVTDQPLETITMPEPTDVNVEFVRVINQHEIAMRVCERGSGETMACGSGACAAALKTIEEGLTVPPVTVHMRGGDLLISRASSGHILMSGPATEVFRGNYMMEE